MEEPAKGEDRLEVVFGAPNQGEAEVVRGLLEAAGIPAFSLDENLIAYDVAIAGATAGYRVAVPADRVGEAREVLADNGFIPAGEADGPPPAE
ncbi:MAG: DUF2007 domain-containing protein [Elusimicrobia bacterium]|nr:DUF2007 domain-containing protein [Elusimicrobiota bacterium]